MLECIALQYKQLNTVTFFLNTCIQWFISAKMPEWENFVVDWAINFKPHTAPCQYENGFHWIPLVWAQRDESYLVWCIRSKVGVGGFQWVVDCCNHQPRDMRMHTVMLQADIPLQKSALFQFMADWRLSFRNLQYVSLFTCRKSVAITMFIFQKTVNMSFPALVLLEDFWALMLKDDTTLCTSQCHDSAKKTVVLCFILDQQEPSWVHLLRCMCQLMWHPMHAHFVKFQLIMDWTNMHFQHHKKIIQSYSVNFLNQVFCFCNTVRSIT